jgi:LysR family transcriptional activator of mexEF-oprN operon
MQVSTTKLAIKSIRFMATIDHFNLRSFDLNLLVAFDAMMTEGSVTRAARRLRIGQPAMSHALSTLRMLMQDELFIRVGQVMQPTARARSLAVPVSQALRQAQLALQGSPAFDPATEDHIFRLAMSPEVETLLLPDLTARLRDVAPSVRVLARVFSYDAAEPSLEDGSIDLAVGCTYARTARRLSETLYKSEVACCFNAALLPLPIPLERKTYLAAHHAVISQNENLQGCIKEALELAGVELDIVMAAPGYLAVLAAAVCSPVVATVPRRIAEKYGPILGLTLSELPIPLSLPPVTMVWAAHADADPANTWMRQMIRDRLTCDLAVLLPTK